MGGLTLVSGTGLMENFMWLRLVIYIWIAVLSVRQILTGIILITIGCMRKRNIVAIGQPIL